MSSTVVLITGANSGVGYATAQVIARASDVFRVIMTGRSIDKVNAAKSEIEAEGGIKGQLSALQLDVTKEDSIQQALEYVQQNFGQLDVLINNAAAGNNNDNPRIRFEAAFQTNLLGPVMVTDAFRPLLLKSKNPYSIYVSSGAGSITLAEQPSKNTEPPNADAYKSTKAALNMIAVYEYKKYKSQGLKVFALSPGFVVSNLRGTSPEARNPGGKAGDPKVSGQTILKVIQGERDADAGKLVHKDGVYPW